MYLPPNIAELLLNTLNRLTLILWRSGIQILLFLAGLQGISSSLYEAAKVDGERLGGLLEDHAADAVADLPGEHHLLDC